MNITNLSLSMQQREEITPPEGRKFTFLLLFLSSELMIAYSDLTPQFLQPNNCKEAKGLAFMFSMTNSHYDSRLDSCVRNTKLIGRKELSGIPPHFHFGKLFIFAEIKLNAVVRLSGRHKNRTGVLYFRF